MFEKTRTGYTVNVSAILRSINELEDEVKGLQDEVKRLKEENKELKQKLTNIQNKREGEDVE